MVSERRGGLRNPKSSEIGVLHDRGIPFFGENMLSERRGGLLNPKSSEIGVLHDRGIPFFGENMVSERRGGLLNPKSSEIGVLHDRGIPFVGENMVSKRRGSLTPKSPEIEQFFFCTIILVVYLGHGGIFHPVYRLYFYLKNCIFGEGLELPD